MFLIFASVCFACLTQTLYGKNATAYQSASLMYGELQDEMCTQLNFSGCHSIVAMPNIDNAQRVDITRNDLYGIVRLPFECVFLNIFRARFCAQVSQLSERRETARQRLLSALQMHMLRTRRRRSAQVWWKGHHHRTSR